MNFVADLDRYSSSLPVAPDEFTALKDTERCKTAPKRFIVELRCKYIKPVKAGFKCTQCSKGDVIQKMWKGKKFWGCSRYPDCKFSISGEIEETPCSKCNNPYLLKRVDEEGRITLTCGNKSCMNVKTIEPTPEGEH